MGWLGGWGSSAFRSRSRLVSASGIFCVLLNCLGAQAQFGVGNVKVTGTLSSSNGLPAYNYGIALVPTQQFFVAGTTVVVTGNNCATDDGGNVVSIRNPLSPPVVNIVYTGTLPAGNYYIVFTWYDTSSHETVASPEIQAQLTMNGQLQISPPISGAQLDAEGMRVYIGTTSGGETLQGHTVSPTAPFDQTTPLVAGTALPTSNTTVCTVIANDTGWPSNTGYNVTMTDPSGNTLPGYPQVWQFLGAGSTYNLSDGLPVYNGRVIYPVPILAQPYNHNPQSISGALSLTGYNIYNVGELGVGTATPAWGVDVEGAGLAGAINALSGYLVNGNGGTAGQCIVSDGTYFDTPANCTIPTLFYQTVDANGTAQTQRPVLNFSSLFVLSDSASPAQTNVTLNPTGNGLRVVTETAAPGASTSLAQYDGAGNIQPAGATTCGTFTSTTSAGCTVLADGKVLQWKAGAALNLSSCSPGSPAASPSPYGGLCSEPTITLTWPVSFPTACLAPSVQDTNSVVDPTDAGSGQTFASGSWSVIGTTSTTAIEVQRVVYRADSGVASTFTSYNGHPIAYCIGN